MENQKATLFNTPESIHYYKLVHLRRALKLELVGLKSRGRSAYSIAKSEFGLKGNRDKVLSQINNLIEKARLEVK